MLLGFYRKDIMSHCEDGLRALHAMWHEVVDPSNVALESAKIILHDTDPESCVIVVMAVVEAKHCNRLQVIAHEALSDAMTEVYGVPQKHKLV